MVAEIKDQEMGDGMQCMNHPYTKNPGGICAFCLQEKLGKLVSSSFPLPKQVFSSSPSSSSPSLRSDSVGSGTSVAGNLPSASLSLSISVAKPANKNVNEGYFCNKNHGRATRIPFLLAKKKKKMMSATAASSSEADRTAGIVLERSKSTATPRKAFSEDFSPRKRGGFWSFLHLSSSSKNQSNATRKPDRTQERMPQNETGLSRDERFRARINQNGGGSFKDEKFGARTCQNENGSSKGDRFGARTSQDEYGFSKDDKFGARTSQNVIGSSKDDRFGATTSQNEIGSSKDDRFGARSSQKQNGFSEDDKFGARTSQIENVASSTSTTTTTTTAAATMAASFTKKGTGSMNGFSVIVEEEDDSPNMVVTEAGNESVPSFDRKVSRSRSVGCGNRSFSGDFFERISNGFGDCSTLRRVESQREGKPKLGSNSTNNVGSLVRCGGIFSGFMIMASSTSSSSSWVSSTAADHHHHNGIRQGSFVQGSRNRSWGWTFGSPMRAFSGTNNTASTKSFASSATKEGKRSRIITESSNKNTTPNLDSIPSLLTVRS